MSISPTIRPVRWPDDEAGLERIDTSFTTDLFYRVQRQVLSFSLIAEAVDPPIVKSYGSAIREPERLRYMGHVAVAERSGELIGICAADLSAWNQRVQIERMYISPEARGQGVGKALLITAIEYARSIGSWCVWLETQNVNYPAIQFYRRCGFRLCGLDERLYDPAYNTLSETAVYFVLDLK
jgi:GNAT superfamily N-acetyltransferase